MINYDDPIVQLDDQLDKMAESLQLDDTRRARMESAYKSIHQYVLEDPLFFKELVSEAYSQGSVRTGTTNKPYKGNEFDLDTVIQLKCLANRYSPDVIRKELERRLREPSSRWKDNLEPKSRCLRIHYENDFHVDVLAASQMSDSCKNTIVLLNKENKQICTSNPRGHADWFTYKANLVTESLLERADKQFRASASLERLPSENFIRKKPLQRSVQLLKRYRDIFFSNDDTYATSSVILTTIAAQYYNGEQSIYQAMNGIVNRIVNDADRFVGVYGGRIKVLNPVNNNEDFTSKWDTEPQYYYWFLRFARHLKAEWVKFQTQQGLVNESRTLKGLFGEDAYNGGAEIRVKQMNAMREAGKLRQDRNTGILTSSTVASTIIKPTTFYGE